MYAMLLAFVLGSMYQPQVVQEHFGNIQPRGNTNFLLVPAQKGYYYQVNVRGLNQGGDIDCYLLTKNTKGHGYVIFTSDESNNNKCSFSFYATKDMELKLWLANNGTANDAYDVRVSQ